MSSVLTMFAVTVGLAFTSQRTGKIESAALEISGPPLGTILKPRRES